MAKEKEGYRENLEILNKRFPDVDMLSPLQVMQVFGFTDRRTLRRRIPNNWVGNRLSKVYLAQRMCGESTAQRKR